MSLNVSSTRWLALVLFVAVVVISAAAGLGDAAIDVARIAVFVVVLLVGAGVWLRERALSGPLRRIAAANGWTFRKKAGDVAVGWRGTPFGSGTRCSSSCVINGTVDGRGFKAFNYNVTTPSGRSKSTEYFSVVALDLRIDLPVVEIRETAGGVEQALGLSRIEFEHEGFNRRYRVSAADAKYASDVLSPRTIEAVLAGRIVNLRIGGGRAVAWAVGRLEVDEVLGWSRALVTVVDRVPDFVWKDHAPQQAGHGLTWPAGASSLGSLPSPSQESP